MRILIVSQYFFPESFRVNDVARGLSERGHAVTVLAGQPNYETGSFFEGYSAFSPSKEAIEGIEVYRFPLVSRGQGTGLRLAANYLSFAVSSSLLSPLRLRERFDAILVYQMSPVTMTLPALVLKQLRKSPVVMWIQDLWPDTLRAVGKVRSERLLKAMGSFVAGMYRASDLVLVESEAFLPAVEAAGLPPHRISYLPEWAESFYRPVIVEPDAAEREEMPHGFRAVFAGNIGVAQSVGTIIEAAAHLRAHEQIRWVMIGDGRRRDWAEEQVEALGLKERFRFLGRRPAPVMPRYLALADVALITLRRDPAFAMTIPAKLPSYLACGRPIAAALDGEGARVVGDSRAGLACPAEDAGALAEVVLNLSELPQADLDEMGRRGRAYYERNFDREMLLTRLEQLLEQAMSSRRSR